jgi:hypothetical protein
MPKKPRYSLALDSASSRLALSIRKKFYTIRASLGVRLAYRRNAGPGTWTVLGRQGWSQRFGVADDYEPANGTSVFNFDQAIVTALRLARGDDTSEIEGGKPITVGEALAAYRRELAATGRRPSNAARVLHHMPAWLAAKPVGLLTPRDLRAFRDLLLAKELRPATVNRTQAMLAAALTLAAKDDPRLVNHRSWRALALRDATVGRPALWVLTDGQVAAAVKAAYAGSYRFGLLVETLATLGVRPVQARRLVCSDLDAAHGVLRMPSSLKGSGRMRVSHEPLPIPRSLALRLEAEAAGRDAHAPLLRDDAGRAWLESSHPHKWEAVAKAAKLPVHDKEHRYRHVGIYSLRHASIARGLLRGLPVALVAKSHDTSAAEIARHYGRYIAHADAAQDMLRAALPSFDAPAEATANVVPIGRTRA